MLYVRTVKKILVKTLATADSYQDHDFQKKGRSFWENNNNKELTRKKSISGGRQSLIQLMHNSDSKQIPPTDMKWKIFRGRQAAEVVI